MQATHPNLYETWRSNTAGGSRKAPEETSNMKTGFEPEQPDCRNQFVMSASGADRPVNKFKGGSLDFETTNNFFH